ncbi:MAG: hypothetical protein ACTTHM_04640 [Peptoanaerobacter stomatis]|uniref:hypothetical protein n=1 Tax=Peptoanaerobacter stomatis TaxID=796937 RepID=UPI003FA0B49A
MKDLKKNFYKKWWFWVIIIFVYSSIINGVGTKEDVSNSNTQEQKQEQKAEEAKQDENESELDKIDFSVRNVRNDVTGNWRISVIADNIDIEKYALEYYNKFFKDDKEIHFIVNFNYNTTTRITSMGNLLDVSILEYVKKEEHDAKELGGGMLLKEYHINKDTGEIKEIQEIKPKHLQNVGAFNIAKIFKNNY